MVGVLHIDVMPVALQVMAGFVNVRMEKRRKMSQKLEKFKTHLHENKKVYITGAICLTTGIVMGVVFKSRSMSTQITNTVAPVISPTFNNVVTNVNFGGYAHKLVKNDMTNEIWETVTEAADAAGVGVARMSRHLNGHTDHINNVTYSIIGLGVAS